MSIPKCIVCSHDKRIDQMCKLLLISVNLSCFPEKVISPRFWSVPGRNALTRADLHMTRADLSAEMSQKKSTVKIQLRQFGICIFCYFEQTKNNLENTYSPFCLNATFHVTTSWLMMLLHEKFMMLLHEKFMSSSYIFQYNWKIYVHITKEIVCIQSCFTMMFLNSCSRWMWFVLSSFS